MSAPRIVAGEWRGRPLEVPLQGVRPTSNRMREAVFNILGAEIEDAVFLDLFAGTGAMGLEALSRGAARAVFVERDREACAAIKANAERFGAAARAQVLAGDATRTAFGPLRVDIAYLDPPYSGDLLAPALTNLARSGTIDGDSLVLAEYGSRAGMPLVAGFVVERQKRYGAGALAILRLLPDACEGLGTES